MGKNVHIVAAAVFFCLPIISLSVWPELVWQLQFFIYTVILFVISIVNRPRPLFLLLLIFCVALGWGRMWWWQAQYENPDILLQDKTEYQLEGVVVTEPDQREYNTRMVVRLHESDTSVLALTPRYPEYQYGDVLRMRGEVRFPDNFIGDTGRTFNYVEYLKKDLIYYQMFYPEIEVMGQGAANPITAWLLETKHAFIGQINRVLGEPHASLLGGLTVGAKSSMGEELLDDFRRTGVVHMVVLSGFNVTVIAEIIMRLLSFLGLTLSAVFGSISIFLFAVMTGASATIVRASIMAVLVIIARVVGRPDDIVRALCIAGCLMLFHNPMLLVFDPSFQLSFMATLGLIVMVPWLEKKLAWVPRTTIDLRGLVAASLAAQVFVTPLLLWMMGELSLVSPIVNILVLWAVPPVMASGFIMVIISGISEPFSLPITLVTHTILLYILKTVDVFATLPFASFTLPSFSFAWVVASYILYVLVAKRKTILILVFDQKHKRRVGSERS